MSNIERRTVRIGFVSGYDGPVPTHLIAHSHATKGAAEHEYVRADLCRGGGKEDARLRHWVAHWDHGKVAVPSHVVPTAEGADEHRANGWRVEGPFVPEATTQGGVEALLPYVRHRDPACVSDVVSEGRCQCGLSAVLRRLGGQ